MNTTKKPCRECPYRKASAPGYLGECNYDPERFLLQLNNPDLHPCHLTINWEDYTEEEILEAKTCIGALQFMNNSMMLSHSAKVREMQKQAGKNPDVFQFKHNFINHHKAEE